MQKEEHFLVWERMVKKNTTTGKPGPAELQVPQDSETRAKIRTAVKAYLEGRAIQNPVSMERLKEIAGEILDLHKWNPEFTAFVMVVCGNEVWRPHFGSVAFNRRILLLPQCLRHSKECKAPLDVYGLMCIECGKCTISGIISKAENLGYHVLVMEGTGIARQLIENGKMDAVLGVGCMESLQKVFDSLYQYSVPGLAVPLLFDGCVDTKTDLDWLYDELLFKNGSIMPEYLSLATTKDKIETIFNPKKLDEILGPAITETEKIARDYILSGGQRYRPAIAAMVYEAYSGNKNDAILENIVVSLECFHKASLVHDDIEDDDISRYGKETLHRKFGNAVAINIGDFLLGEGYFLLAAMNLPRENLQEVLKIVSAGHRALSLGQGAELLSVFHKKTVPLSEINDLFSKKTSSAFEVSLLLGAACGNAPDSEKEILQKFGHSLGIVYQLKDDIADFPKKDSNAKISWASVIMSLLLDKINEDDLILLQTAMANENPSVIYSFVDKYEILKEASNLLQSQVLHARESVEELKQPNLKAALLQLLHKVISV